MSGFVCGRHGLLCRSSGLYLLVVKVQSATRGGIACPSAAPIAGWQYADFETSSSTLFRRVLTLTEMNAVNKDVGIFYWVAEKKTCFFYLDKFNIKTYNTLNYHLSLMELYAVETLQ